MKHADQVFKITDGTRVTVWPGGDVSSANGPVIIGSIKGYGWHDANYFIAQGAYDNQWDKLFELAKTIFR